jgi:formate C-acetyltransferase
MNKKHHDAENHREMSKPNQSQYLAGSRTVFLDINGPISMENQGIGLPSIDGSDPHAATLGNDIALKSVTFDSPGFQKIKQWREKLFRDMPQITDELPRLLTEYMRQSEGNGDSPYLRRAKALKHVFVNKTPIVHTADLLPGHTTNSIQGPVCYIDTVGSVIWPELNSVSTRAINPFKIEPEVARRLNREIFPYWMRRSIQEIARYSDYSTENYPNRDEVVGTSQEPPLKKKAGETPRCQQLYERVAFYIAFIASCVSHTVPDFNRLVKYGLQNLINRMDEDVTNYKLDDDQKDFITGVKEVFAGAITYANHLADEAEKAANHELARICRKVPEYPAATLHEAVVSVWIMYHLLLQENTHYGFSIGRLDQVLQPYYLADWRRLHLDPASEEEKNDYRTKAVELICHFFLKVSDNIPLSSETAESLFAGSGANQALTVGGTNLDRESGRVENAVNDMTYIILKATELLTVRDPNVHARYHADIHHRDAAGKRLPPHEVSPYLKRLCEVNLNTRATPAIHGDVSVTESLAGYYESHRGIDAEEALADAYDYCSIGCIEENSAGRHYGYTGALNIALSTVLEMAMFGGKHRSDGIDAASPNWAHAGREYTSKPLWQMQSMDEFVEAFKFQMDEYAKMTVQCHNYMGRFTEKYRPVPLLSGLFIGPTNIPDAPRKTNKAKFRDLSSGGAKYNSVGVSVIGIADVIDSFCSIDNLIFSGRHGITAPELILAMEADYEESNLNRLADSSSRLICEFYKRHRLNAARLKQIKDLIRFGPRYGKGIGEENQLALHYTKEIPKIIQDTYYKYRTYRGGRFLVGYWSMTIHAGYGLLHQATPNLRRNGEAFAGGATPCPGLVNADGSLPNILDQLYSVSSIDNTHVQNGCTYNLTLTARREEPHLAEDNLRFAQYVKAFMENKGILVQMSIASIDKFKKAHAAAKQAIRQGISWQERCSILAPYQDLMIRVAGYSAYFVSLSHEMREEIIARANFALKDGDDQHRYTIELH